MHGNLIQYKFSAYYNTFCFKAACFTVTIRKYMYCYQSDMRQEYTAISYGVSICHINQMIRGCSYRENECFNLSLIGVYALHVLKLLAVNV